MFSKTLPVRAAARRPFLSTSPIDHQIELLHCPATSYSSPDDGFADETTARIDRVTNGWA